MAEFLIGKEDFRELLKNIFSGDKDVNYYGKEFAKFTGHSYIEYEGITYIEDTTGIVPKGLLISTCKISDLVSF